MKFSKEDREYYDKLLAESDEMQKKNNNKTYTLEEVCQIFQNIYKKENI